MLQIRSTLPVGRAGELFAFVAHKERFDVRQTLDRRRPGDAYDKCCIASDTADSGLGVDLVMCSQVIPWQAQEGKQCVKGKVLGL